MGVIKSIIAETRENLPLVLGIMDERGASSHRPFHRHRCALGAAAMSDRDKPTPAERDLFRLLVNHVSGIGPKLALAVLSGMSVTNFKAAVVNSDVTAISKISGLGKKTAERIVLELKDKVGVAAAWEAASAAHSPSPEQEQANEAVLALIALGYKQVDAHKAVHDLQQKGEAKSSEELVKLTLKRMAAGR